MRNYFVKILLSFIGISYAMFVNAQDSIVGRILDEQEQGLDAAVVMLASLPDNVLIETTITDSDGKFCFPVHKGEFLLCVARYSGNSTKISSYDNFVKRKDSD